ncbi:hypothetical protein [Acaryochloris sp. IP29b_bin.137]|uniref:hypothetical protein n=1 Tax=Acaryochloris sp. IP29b_bin.137 TaxID=2969217 RepID=UPI002634E054|nr:hypothetical protein [Acaryochloris sp. IP29b_bin.137]
MSDYIELIAKNQALLQEQIDSWPLKVQWIKTVSISENHFANELRVNGRSGITYLTGKYKTEFIKLLDTLRPSADVNLVSLRKGDIMRTVL